MRSLRKTEKKELKLVVFERKILRKIYHSIFDIQANGWRRLYNDELQTQFQRPDTWLKRLPHLIM